jgi:hypothetical protein
MDHKSQQGFLDEPIIIKKKPLILILIWFGSVAFATFAGQWALLEPFDFHKNIFISGTVWPWFYMFVISLLVALSATSIRFAIYYRLLYRDYKGRNLVDNLFPNRTHLQGKYKDFIENAEKEVHVFGMSLHTLISNTEIQNAIVLAASSRKITFKFLIQDPDCPFLIDRAKQEGGVDEKRISKDSGEHLQTLLQLKQKAAALSGTIEVRTIKDKMPDCYYFRHDDSLFIEPYLLGYKGRDCPVFSIKKNSLNASFFDAFVRAMERKWNDAEPK